MLQNVRVIAFAVSELLTESQQEGGRGGGVKLPPNQIRVKECDTYCSNEEVIFNQTLRSTRNQIKCALGTLKARWQIL